MYYLSESQLIQELVVVFRVSGRGRLISRRMSASTGVRHLMSRRKGRWSRAADQSGCRSQRSTHH